MATDKEQAVQKSFDRAMEQINKLQKAFREEGLLAKAVAEMGGNTKFNDIQDAMSNLYDALEDGHYDAFSGRSGASIHGEGNTMENTEEVKEAKTQELMDEVIIQIKRDCDMGDYTAIEELLQSCPEANLRGFLSDIGSPESSGRMNDYSEEAVSEETVKIRAVKDKEHLKLPTTGINRTFDGPDAKEHAAIAKAQFEKDGYHVVYEDVAENKDVTRIKKLAGI